MHGTEHATPHATPHVTLHLWTVPRRSVAAAAVGMATGRPALRRQPGLRFGRLLGTGDGRTFTARDADLHRWGLLAVWDDAAAAGAFRGTSLCRGWERRAEESWRVDLRPLASRGRWSGREPFGSGTARQGHAGGVVAALTRARLRPTRALGFWRAVPPVSADLHGGGPGLRYAVGVGEAPVGLQGTFSLWDSAAALRDFAYARPAHVEVVRRTAEERWYAEELFARFAVLGSSGTVDGRDPAAAP